MHRGFRPDVEGLRAVAVLLVVFDHLFAWPSGGFVGVDVFFVISGFLITGLLVAEHEHRGGISFRGFYARRARRILPVSIVVLVSTWLVARAVQLSSQVHQTGVDVLWSAGFLANVHFARISTDYFQSNTVHSPVQHYWSLAVEEQFYLVWPVLIVVVLGAARRLRGGRGGRGGLGGRAPRLALAAVLGAGVAASFAFSWHQTRTDPNAAYFATAGRAWELGLGALVALCVPLLRKLPAPVRAVGALAGLAAIVVSAFEIDSGTAFPAPGAVVPVVGAAVLIAAGVGGVSAAAFPLTNPVSRYVGRVSYSLYLWHWPVLVLLAELMPDGTAAYDVVALAAMAALTVASYHYVEAPMRRMRWSSLRPQPARALAALSRRRAALVRPAAAVVTCTVVAIGAFALQPAQHIAAVTPTVHVPAAGAIRPDRGLAAQIDDALGARKWPDLDPGPDNVTDDRAPEWQECAHVDPSDAEQCLFQPAHGVPATRSAVVLGDSVAVSWLPALRDALGPEGYSVRGLTLFQCGVGEVSMVEANRGADEKFVRSCNRHRSDTYRALERLRPELVVVSSAENVFSRLASHATGAAAHREWLQGMRAALRHIHDASPRSQIVVLSPPPAGSNIALCVSPTLGPQTCVTSIHADWLTQSELERSAAREVRAQYIDVHLLLCNKDGICPSFIDGHLVRCDGLHLTATEARRIAPYLHRELLSK